MARQTDTERKAAAIADLMNGDQPAIVAERYGFPADTVRKWKQRFVTATVTEIVTDAVTPMPRKPALEAQQMAIGDLILANVRAKLSATEKIAAYVTTESWLDKQNAADVATLLEVLDRSAIGILDRLAQRGRANDSAERTDGAAPDADP